MLDGTTSVVEGNQTEYSADWRQIDAALKKIAKRRRELDLEEAEWLVKAERAKVHVHRGCGSFLEYLEQVLGYAPRTAIDRMRVAHALDEFPALREAELSFSALRELARVVTKETVDKWIAQSKGKSLREIEALVSGHKRGDDPDGPRGPETHVLRLELAPETLALLREVQRDLAGELGHDIDDNTLINQLCRGLKNAGATKKPTYQIAITKCDTCQRTYQDGGGITVEVSPAVRDQAECDAAHVGRLDAPTPPTVDIPAAIRAQVWLRDHGRCTVPGCRAKRCLDIHHLKHRKDGGTHTLENLILICSGHHAAHHAGTLAISGTGSHPRFSRLVDSTPPPAKTTADDVRRLLTSLGFSPREAKVATETAAAHVGAHPSVDALLRAALSTLHPQAQAQGSGKGY